MKGDTGTILVIPDGTGNIHLQRVTLGPSQEQIDELRRYVLDEKRRRGVPTRLEMTAQAKGAKLLNMAIPAKIRDGDFAQIDDRVYRVVIEHGRNLDDVDDRIASAQIETGAHEVLARGGGLVIQPDRVAPEVMRQFISDFPAIAQILAGRAFDHFTEEHAKKSGLRRVLVSAHEVGHAMLENHESLLLALLGVGLTVAVPPLVVLGIPLEIEVAMLGLAALVARDAKSALNDDGSRRERAALVRKHLNDVIVRADAIERFNKWAHGLGKRRTRSAPQRRPAAARLSPVSQSSQVVMPQLMPVYAGAATPRVIALA
jgi:hypothetical protein